MNPDQKMAGVRRRRALYSVGALVTVGAAVAAHPEVAGHVFADDGTINDPPLVHWMHYLVWVMGAWALGLAWAARYLSRRPLRSGVVRVLVLFAVLGVLAAGVRTLYLHRASQIDVLAHLEPDHDMAKRVLTVQAERGRSEALLELGRAVRSREPLPMILPEQIWSVSPDERRKFARLALEGAPGRIWDLEVAGWSPGEPLKMGARPRSIVFHLQRQVFLFYLVYGVEEATEKATIDFVDAFLQAWEAEHPRGRAPRDWLWADDPTANRAQAREVGMNFLRSRGATTPEREVEHLEWVLRHGRELMREDAHTTHSNHGQMQNSALLTLGVLHPELADSDRWINTAVERAEAYVRRNVTERGVLRELAPFYHHHSTKKLLWFYGEATAAGVELSKTFSSRLRLMSLFYRTMLYPDGRFPQIADTDGYRPDLSHWPWSDTPAWPELSALRDALAEQDRPIAGPEASYWPDSGYFILRPAASPYKINTTTMLTMTAGPASTTHIHYNKLAITLFGSGMPLIPGPGYPSYFDVERRSRLISTPNQNTVSVDGESQRLGAAPASLVHIVEGTGGPDLAIVRAVSELYDEVSHARTVIYGAESDAVLLVDELTSEAEHVYDLAFRRGDGIEVIESAETLGLVYVKDDQPVLRFDFDVVGDGIDSIVLDSQGDMVGARVEGRGSIRVLTRLETSPSEGRAEIDLEPTSLRWSGNRGELETTIPVRDRQGVRWTPRDGF